jgi:hypothetical protein
MKPFPLGRHEKMRCMTGGQSVETDYSLSSFTIRTSDNSLCLQGKADMKNVFVILDLTSSSEFVVASFVGTSPNRSRTFASVLTTVSCADSFLPLFAQLDLTVQEDGPSVSAPELVNIPHSFLQLNPVIEERFAENADARAICHLVMYAEPKHLTCELFDGFHNIVRTSTSQTLRRQLFLAIL